MLKSDFPITITLLSTKLMRKLKPKFIFLFFLLFGSLILISGCESKELKAMLESPLANMQLTTAREVARSHKDKEVTLGKPIYAKVRIKYEPTGNYTKEDVFNEIVKNIEKNGWEREWGRNDNSGQSGYYSASLPYESFSLIVEVLRRPGLSTVSVYLGHRARQIQPQ